MSLLLPLAYVKDEKKKVYKISTKDEEGGNVHISLFAISRERKKVAFKKKKRRK